MSEGRSRAEAGVDARGPGTRASTPALPKGWHNRGYLPHFDSAEVVQTVTFRLADSLPTHVLEEVLRNPDRQRRRRLVDAHLDRGRGACLLRKPEAAAVVAGALDHFDGERYKLFAWVVMPNHVHVMIEPQKGNRLGDILGSWKTFTAKSINQLEKTSGSIWARDYFDRYVRDEAHFARVVAYIEENPVKAALVRQASQWRFSSAWRR